jgi:hypothetical protein
MRVAALRIGLLGAAMIAGVESAPAADRRPSFTIVTPGNAADKAWRRVHRRAVVYRTRSSIIRRTIGMPCVLPPDAIVQLDWNGPQCRWIDNVIPGDGRRGMIKIRRYVHRFGSV